MLVTVAICTWNRAALLDRTLAELRGLRIPDGVEWELLVVNNNSTDHTDAVLARHAGILPLRRIPEAEQGLSHARNRAISEAGGELILWTDDDVLVDPDWLAAYAEAARRWPEAAFFGGPIAPWYETTPPPWLVADPALVEGLLVIRDLGPSERPLADGELPFGANMGLRRSAVGRRRFDPRLGRSASESILGEETAFMADLQRRGLQGVWVPGARVRHYVPGGRVTLSYLRDYFRGVGRTMVRSGAYAEGPASRGVPRWLYRAYFEALIQGSWRRLLGRERWIATYAHAARLRGIIDECRYRSRLTGRPGAAPSATEAAR